MEASALKRGRHAVRQMRKASPYHDRRRLNKKEFHVYINTVCSEMTGGEEVRLSFSCFSLCSLVLISVKIKKMHKFMSYFEVDPMFYVQIEILVAFRCRLM